jgi:hypothetical protein
VLPAVQTHSIIVLNETKRKVQSDIPLLKHGVFVAADIYKVSKLFFNLFSRNLRFN